MNDNDARRGIDGDPIIFKTEIGEGNGAEKSVKLHQG
jgi:hypothetical protein